MLTWVSRWLRNVRVGITSYIRDEQARYGTLFVLPTFFFFCIFIVWPVGYSFYLGFYDWNPLDPEPVYIGIDNYRELFESPDFLHVILNTLIFIAGNLMLVLIGAMALALALNQGLRGTTLFRAIYYSPVVTALVATAVYLGVDTRSAIRHCQPGVTHGRSAGTGLGSRFVLGHANCDLGGGLG